MVHRLNLSNMLVLSLSMIFSGLSGHIEEPMVSFGPNFFLFSITKQTLDHSYTPFKDSSKTQSFPPLGTFVITTVYTVLPKVFAYLPDIPFLIHMVKYDVGPLFASRRASVLVYFSTRFRSVFIGFLTNLLEVHL